MLSKKMTALAAISLVTASTAAAAQSPAPGQTPAVERAGTEAQGSNELRGGTVWILGAIVLGLLIWGAIELLNDDEDAPTSP